MSLRPESLESLIMRGSRDEHDPAEWDLFLLLPSVDSDVPVGVPNSLTLPGNQTVFIRE